MVSFALGAALFAASPSTPAHAGGPVPPTITVVPTTVGPVVPGDTISYTVNVVNNDPTIPLHVTHVASLDLACSQADTDHDDIPANGGDEDITTCTHVARNHDLPEFAGAIVEVFFSEIDSIVSTPAPAIGVAYPPHGFTDVADTDFYGDAAYWGKFFELVAGFPDGTFRPDADVTRGQIVNMLWHAVDEPVVNTPHGFVDVPAGAFYRQALNWAKARHLVTGFAGNRYRPMQPVTLGQLVNMVWKMVGSPSSSGPGYTDVPVVFRDAARWVRQHQLAQPFAPGPQLHPAQSATRAEVLYVVFTLAGDRFGWERWNKAPVSTWRFDDALVVIRNRRFIVNRTTIFPGETVSWQNDDTGSGTLHTVTSDEDLWPALGLGALDTDPITFDAETYPPGVYTYHCTIHPDMTGRVTIQAP